MSVAKKKAELELYREAMGDEKADRQAELAKYVHKCCGNPKDQGHHGLCPKAQGRRG